MTAAMAVAAVPPLALAQSARNAKPDDSNAPATIRAEQMSGRPDREINLDNNVEITRGSTTVEADKAIYSVVEDQVDASGHIKMQRLGDRYSGDTLKLKLDSGVGFVTNPTYRLQTSNGQGKAERIDFESEERATLTSGTYSTCEGPDPDWYLKSDTLLLDRGRDIGNASNSIIYFKGVPILGAPRMSFPLSDARKSGVLAPNFYPNNKGAELTVPYYFNIAPNRDLTLYPKLITNRGLQFGLDGRYLGDSYGGETKLEFLPGDRQTGTSRYAIASTHAQTFGPNLSLGWNINAASDDQYPDDFSRSITNSSQRLLLRDIDLNYAGTFWNAAIRTSNYQVLQDLAAPITRPYDRLPQLTFQAARQDVHGFDWSLDSEWTRFWNPDQLVPIPQILPRGDRLIVNPKISYPIIRPGYFITPKLSLHLTDYSLDHVATGTPTTLTRALPTMSVDSGLVFERATTLFGSAVTQTLEPRLFYVYTPYRDQSQFPNFDTSEADFNYTQLFSENRFIGGDRISDANQLTAALVSRYIEPWGGERIRLAVGQRYYLTAPRVTLNTAINESRSDLLVAANGNISSTVSAEVNMQYSQSLRTMSEANYGVHWQPAPKRVLNVQYLRDMPNALEQFVVSGQWPIAQRWYGVGRVNYSLKDQKTADALLGFEYKADCWVFRAVAQRTPTSTQSATTGIFLQLELNGLSRLGSNPLETLRSNIPGYQVVNERK